MSDEAFPWLHIPRVGMGPLHAPARAPAPFTRCMNCGDQVEGEYRGEWVFPLDERGWCTDCAWMEHIDVPEEEKPKPKKRRRTRADSVEIPVSTQDFVDALEMKP